MLLCLWRCGFIMLVGILLVACDTLTAQDTQLPANTPVSVRVEPVQTQSPEMNVPPETATITDTPAPTHTPLPFALEDALSVMSGICFESAFDAAGQVFVMRNAEEHIRLYDLADHSELCRRPIIRHPFNFDGGRILAGIWTAGIGCTADHQVLDYRRDDASKTITIQLRFVTDGDCPYELVRPFWVAIGDAQDYEVIINVEDGTAS